MDQMTAACGEANRLLELLCQPADLKGTIALPEELEIWGIDSGIRHSVGGADYRTVRTAAFMGYRIITELAGLSVTAAGPGNLVIDDPRWNGYLANISPPDFQREYAPHIPENMSGRDFLDKYRGITDTVTSVDPAINYPVLAATRHPIYEHARVTSFAAILKDWKGEQKQKLGELLYESHESYSRCGLGSDQTDALVTLVRQSSGDDLYGAKITGGGSGGTVALLGRRGARAAVHEVAARYREQTGYEPAIISGSSSGANAFGYLTIA
jgi:L-arabinokinase